MFFFRRPKTYDFNSIGIPFRFGKLFHLRSDCRDVQWFRRKPAKPTRPAEPPAGTVVRNTRSGAVGKHFAPLNDHYTHNWAFLKIDRDSEWKKWDDWIAPTDEIEVAEWVKP